MKRRLVALVVLLVLTVSWLAAAGPEQDVGGQPVLEVFVRDGCPHCAEAKKFLRTLSSQRPDLQIVYRSLDRDPSAGEDLARRSRESGVWPPGVPTFVFDGQVLVGFESAERSGPGLLALLDRQAMAPSDIETTLFGTLSVSHLGLPLFTLALGLLDGFNPCAMWVLLFLLSMLVHLQDRLRMALIAGTFVLVSAAVYYAFMAAWLNIFLVIGMSATLRLALGGIALVIGIINIKDFVSLKQGPSLSIPDAAKPGLYARMRAIIKADSLPFALAAAAALAVVVNFIELLCTAGFPAMYTAILTQQALSPPAYSSYLALYILGYMADDTLMVATAVIALSSRKLTERAGRWLKFVSGAVMLALGAIMILRPEWLL